MVGCKGESVEERLAEENMRLRKAGAEMAVAALRVATEYDGVHRLMLAVSEWSKAMADEHGRGEDDGSEQEEPEQKQPKVGEFWRSKSDGEIREIADIVYESAWRWVVARLVAGPNVTYRIRVPAAQFLDQYDHEPEITSWAYVSEAKQGPAREAEKRPEPGEFWEAIDDPEILVRVIGTTSRDAVYYEVSAGGTFQSPAWQFMQEFQHDPYRTEF